MHCMSCWIWTWTVQFNEWQQMVPKEQIFLICITRATNGAISLERERGENGKSELAVDIERRENSWDGIYMYSSFHGNMRLWWLKSWVRWLEESLHPCGIILDPTGTFVASILCIVMLSTIWLSISCNVVIFILWNISLYKGDGPEALIVSYNSVYDML